MRRIWRLTRSASARELNGEDNREKGGRWNSPGRGVVYCSSSRALAAMEQWVHMDEKARQNPEPMSAVLLAYPDNAPCLEIARENLPQDLEDPCCVDLCLQMGDAWLDKGEALVLIAPSFVVPHEINIMLNPLHPDARHIRTLTVEDFKFDPRMGHPERK
jgi:RES domain-containing protein